EKSELADDPDRVIHFNRYVRACGRGEFFEDGSWPPQYVVIGSERDQNWFFLDLADGSEAVDLSTTRRARCGGRGGRPLSSRPRWSIGGRTSTGTGSKAR